MRRRATHCIQRDDNIDEDMCVGTGNHWIQTFSSELLIAIGPVFGLSIHFDHLFINDNSIESEIKFLIKRIRGLRERLQALSVCALNVLKY